MSKIAKVVFSGVVAIENDVPKMADTWRHLQNMSYDFTEAHQQKARRLDFVLLF